MIRLYNKKDIPSIVSLEEESLGTSLGYEMLLDNLSNRFSHFYVYEEYKDILGYISISFDGSQGEILNFCVKKDNQHKGIGTKLLAYAINMLHSKGAMSFILEVRESNINAINLYLKFGFKKISIRKNYYSNSENALVLLKEMVSYLDLEDAYITSFCKKIVHEDYIGYTCPEVSGKYFYNYYECPNDDKIMEKLYHREGFVQFDLLHPYTGKLKFSDYESEIELHSSIYGIRILRNTSYKVKRTEESDKEWFINYLYNDSKEYGEKYAKDNALKHASVALDLKKTNWYFVFDDKKPVGFICSFIYKDACKLEDFVLLDEYQHKGYGSALFSYVLNELKEKGIHDIYLTADLEDTPKVMYERMGFTLVGKRYQVREVFE
jgi:ribosomal-protein-alanine N-acetyltransferase